MKKFCNVALRVILIILIGLIIGISVYTLNAKRLLNDALPMPFGYGTSVVLSGSMEPTLSVNDLVIIRKDTSYEVGDVVVYQSGHSLIIHRIIETDGDVVVTQGDANNTADEPFSTTQIKGKMTAHISGVGRIIEFLQSTAGKTGIIALAALFLYLSRREEEKDKVKARDALLEEIERLRKETGAITGDRGSIENVDQINSQKNNGSKGAC